MLKTVLLRQMMKRQLKGLPEADRERILSAIEKNPKLFADIAKETQELVKQGQDQQTAALSVMQKHQAELAELFGGK